MGEFSQDNKGARMSSSNSTIGWPGQEDSGFSHISTLIPLAMDKLRSQSLASIQFSAMSLHYSTSSSG